MILGLLLELMKNVAQFLDRIVVGADIGEQGMGGVKMKKGTVGLVGFDDPEIVTPIAHIPELLLLFPVENGGPVIDRGIETRLFKEIADQAGGRGFAGGSGNGDYYSISRYKMPKKFGAVEDGDTVLLCDKQVGIVSFNRSAVDDDVGLGRDARAVLREKGSAFLFQLKIGSLRRVISSV